MRHPLPPKDTPYRRRFFLLAALAPPLLVQCVWLWHNTQLPVADAAEQLRSSYKLYLLAHEGRLKFFIKLLGMRSEQWRPTLYYLTQVPFQLVSGGNLMFAAAGATLLCTGVTCLYLWRLLRLMLPPPAAALSVCALGMLSAVQWPGTYFGFSEGAFMPAALATLYHLIRSGGLRNRRQCVYFVLAAAAAVAVRPVESFTHFALLFAVYLATGLRQGAFSSGQIYRIALGACAAVDALALAGMLHRLAIYADPARGYAFGLFAEAALTLTLAALSLPLFTRLRYWPDTPAPPGYTVRSFTALYCIVVLLYLPYMPKLVEWVYMCSLGSLAQLRDRPPPGQLLLDMAQSAGIAPLAGIAALAAFSFAFCLDARARRELLRHPLLYALAAIPPTLLMMLTSVQSTPRKATVIFTLALLVLLAAALAPGRFLRLRFGFMLILACGQCAAQFWLATAHALTPDTALFAGGEQAMPVMVTADPNPNRVLSGFLKATASKRGYRRIALPIDTQAAIDPFLLGMLAEVEENPAQVHYVYLSSFGDHGAEDFLRGGDDAFLLIRDTPGPDALSSDPNVKLRYALAALYAQGRFTETDCITLAFPPEEACVIAVARAR